jgi:hypothetical protein
MSNPRVLAACLATAILAFSQAARAALVTVVAQGHITQVQTHTFPDGGTAPDRLGALGIQVGDTFTAQLQYDPSIPAQFTLQPNPTSDPQGTVAYYPASRSYTITVHATTNAGPQDYVFGLPDTTTYAPFIYVQDYHTILSDQFSAGSSGGLGTPLTPLQPTFPTDPMVRQGLQFALTDSTHTAFDDAGIPTAFRLSAFDTRQVAFYVYYDSPGGWNDGNATDYGIFGTIDSATPALPDVPSTPALPGGFAWVGAVLVALAGLAAMRPVRRAA